VPDARWALSWAVLRSGLWRLVPGRWRRRVLPSAHIARFVQGRERARGGWDESGEFYHG
jgi:hypothetical protein